MHTCMNCLNIFSSAHPLSIRGHRICSDVCYGQYRERMKNAHPEWVR